MVTKQLPHRAERFIAEHGLIEKHGPVVVGVSGGVDSVCLLHVLATLRDKLGIDLHVAHLNHQLRGSESDADAEYVSKLARTLGVTATIQERDVRAYQADHRCSLEEAAREVRYTFFSEVAESVGTGAVAVAHTANDQAETMIMHLIRGTGLAGLRGMRPLSRWNMPDGKLLTIIRPLLETGRREAEAYCTAQGLSPRCDSSNSSLEYLRNRVRAEIMPKLLEYNPNIIQSLSRTAHIIGDDISYLDEEVARLSGTIFEELPHGLSLDNEALCNLSPALQRHSLRSALGGLLGSLRDIELIHIENIMDVLTQPAGKRLSLPYGLTFYGDYERSVITHGENPLAIIPTLDGEYRLSIPGETRLPGWRVKAEITDGKVDVQAGDGLTAYLDFDFTSADLRVRTRRDGDRFQPLGMNETKKLQDFMVDSKIPRAWRDRVPLVCSTDRILWVVGWRIDHRARITDSTQRTLCLDFEIE